MEEAVGFQQSAFSSRLSAVGFQQSAVSYQRQFTVVQPVAFWLSHLACDSKALEFIGHTPGFIL
jgi:hypothetical protein